LVLVLLETLLRDEAAGASHGTELIHARAIFITRQKLLRPAFA
jgi:hypothetical protein